MADVDSLLSELDGLLKDSPPGQRPSAPQRPSAAPAAPRLAPGRDAERLAPGRPAVEDDIDSLLSSLGGAEAFSSNAASKATCAPRATCPPAAAPSSSSAPDGTSCATKYVPAARLPAPPCVPAHHAHAHALPPPWQLAVQQVRLQGDALRRPEVERVCRLHVLTELHGRRRQATNQAAAAGWGRSPRVPMQLVHGGQLGRQGAPRLLVPNAMTMPGTPCGNSSARACAASEHYKPPLGAVVVV